MSGNDVHTIDSLLRHRRLESECAQCFKYHSGLLEDFREWYRDSCLDDLQSKASISIRVSCEKALGEKRTCPVMESKGFQFRFFVDGATAEPFTILEDLE